MSNENDNQIELEYLLEVMRNYIESLPFKDKDRYMQSMLNQIKGIPVNKNRDFHLSKGDIAYFDFGIQRGMEASYSRPALVVGVYAAKALVCPCSTNPQRLEDDLNINIYPLPAEKTNLFYDTFVYLNDMKFITVKRLIKKIGKLDVESETFTEIRERLTKMIWNKK